MSLPIGAGVATRAQKPLQFLSKEAGIATSAGVGAATANLMFPSHDRTSYFFFTFSWSKKIN